MSFDRIGRIGRIGIIGTGRTGSALALALCRAGYDVGPLWSRRPARAQAVAARMPGAFPVPCMQAVVDGADLVILAVPDRAIAEVAGSLRWQPGKAVVHTSGGTAVAALLSAARDGAVTGGWHPLKSFAGAQDDSDLAGITFAIESGDAALRRALHELTHALGGLPLTLDAEDRVLYHAAAALASNGVVALLAEATALWSALGVGREAALRALLPLVQGTVANLAAVGLPGALTGPVERGDMVTVAAHLDAIHDRAPETVAVYRALNRRALALAVEKGGRNEEQLTALSALLTDRRSCTIVEGLPRPSGADGGG